MRKEKKKLVRVPQKKQNSSDVAILIKSHQKTLQEIAKALKYPGRLNKQDMATWPKTIIKRIETTMGLHAQCSNDYQAHLDVHSAALREIAAALEFEAGRADGKVWLRDIAPLKQHIKKLVNDKKEATIMCGRLNALADARAKGLEIADANLSKVYELQSKMGGAIAEWEEKALALFIEIRAKNGEIRKATKENL